MDLNFIDRIQDLPEDIRLQFCLDFMHWLFDYMEVELEDEVSEAL